MIAIRLAKKQWGKAWRAMIEIGPVRLVAADPIYEVLPAHLELLNARGFSFELVKTGPNLNNRLVGPAVPAVTDARLSS